jgi:hypothetical protein
MRNHALREQEIPSTAKGLSGEKAVRILAGLRDGNTARHDLSGSPAPSICGGKL